MKRNITKRLAAWFMVLCFVLMQMNLPAGCLKLDLSFLTAHAEEQDTMMTWQSNKSTGHPILYEKNNDGTNTVTANRYNVPLAEKIESEGVKLDQNVVIAEENGTVTINGTIYTVTRIADNCFAGQQNFTTITIPKTVTTIGNSAFSECAFNTITFQEESQCKTIGEKAFYKCTRLGSTGETIELPNQLSQLGASAFESCEQLQKVTFTSPYVSIGASAFTLDKALVAVVLPKELPPNEAGNTETLAGSGIFKDCPKLKAVNIPNQANIPNETFSGCTDLCSINAESVTSATSNVDRTDLDFAKTLTNVETIGASAFKNTKFATIRFSKTNTTIGAHAFESSSLTGLDFSDCDNSDTALIIGEYAFSQTSDIATPVVFANCITELGDSAFNGSKVKLAYFQYNTNIQSIGDLAFAGSNLSRFVVPDNITKIGKQMFDTCQKLEAVSIPKTLTQIDDYAFQNCKKFSTLQLRAGKLTADTENEGAAVEKDLTNSSIESIGINVFSNSGISSFVLPKAVTTLSDCAFSGCSELSNFTFAATNTANKNYIIGKEVFRGCSKLKSVSIPYGVSSLGTGVFTNCENLQSVTIGTNNTDHSTYKTLSRTVFSNCAKLKSFTLSKTCTSIDNDAFNGCSSLTSVSNTSQLTGIGGSAFKGCISFTGFDGTNKLALPANVTSLGQYAFSECTNITELTSTALLNTIQKGTFSKCSKLTKINLGENVNTIDGEAFSDVPLKEIIFNAYNVMKINQTSFNFSATNLTYLTCYENLIEEYQKLFGKYGITIDSDVFHGLKRTTEGTTTKYDSFKAPISDSGVTLKKGDAFNIKDASGAEATNSITWSIADTTIASCTQNESGSEVTVKGIKIGQTTLIGEVNDTDKKIVFTAYVVPNPNNAITNPYVTEPQIFDVSTLSDSELASDESILAAITKHNISSLSSGTIYYDKNNKKTTSKTLYATATLETPGSATEDALYWSCQDSSVKISDIQALNDTTVVQCEKTLYKGSLIKVTPTAENGTIGIQVTTSKEKTSKSAQLAIKPVVQQISATQKISVQVHQQNVNINTIASIKKEPATSTETLLYSIPEAQQDIATIDKSGNLTANKIGKVIVTVSSSETATQTEIEVTVCNPIKDVAITKTEANNTPTTVAKSSTIDIFQGEAINLSFESSVLDPKLASTDKLNFAVTSPGVATAGTPTVVNNITSLTVTAAGTGSTKLTITGTESKFTTDITIRVKTALNSISIDEKDQKQTVSLGETQDLSKFVKSNPVNHNETLTWESNNTSVATVTEKGVVTAVSPGTALITVYCHRTGKSAQFTITADNTITAATITPTTIGTKEKPFYPGASESLKLEITKKNESFPAADTGITWSSSNEQIVTVSGGSLTGATITAVKAGPANIIVKNASGRQLASISVTVTQPTISLENTNVTLYTKIAKRRSYTIKPIINGNDKTVTYKVTKGSKYIKVNSKGKVTYKSKKKIGSGVVTVTANGVSTILNVTINKTAKKKLSVSNSAGELKKKTITVKKSLGTCSSRYTASWVALKVTYKSSKKKVASIDDKGMIKLKKKGTTKITTTVDGYKMTYTLKVK